MGRPERFTGLQRPRRWAIIKDEGKTRAHREGREKTVAQKPFGLAVKAFVSDPEGRWLLIRRSAESKWYAGQWDLPGGKVDPGEEFDVALAREIEEETGLPVELEGLVGADEFEMPHVRVILLYMSASTPGGEARVRAGEHDEAVWVLPEEIKRMDISGQLRPFVLPYIERLLG